MLAVSLVFGSFLTVLFLIVGAILGWIAREYMMNYQDKPKLHSEFFDSNGNIIPDEVIAFRFENGHEYEDIDEDDD
jgi:4-hydroxybenzoate polyprenyltransferase